MTIHDFKSKLDFTEDDYQKLIDTPSDYDLYEFDHFIAINWELCENKGIEKIDEMVKVMNNEYKMLKEEIIIE